MATLSRQLRIKHVTYQHVALPRISRSVCKCYLQVLLTAYFELHFFILQFGFGFDCSLLTTIMHALRLVDTIPATNRTIATYPAASGQPKQCHCRHVNSTKMIVSIEVHKVLQTLELVHQKMQSGIWSFLRVYNKTAGWG